MQILQVYLVMGLSTARSLPPSWGSCITCRVAENSNVRRSCSGRVNGLDANRLECIWSSWIRSQTSLKRNRAIRRSPTWYLCSVGDTRAHIGGFALS